MMRRRACLWLLFPLAIVVLVVTAASVAIARAAKVLSFERVGTRVVRAFHPLPEQAANTLRAPDFASGQRRQPSSGMVGGWRLLRNQGPQGGADTITIMHTADTARSDIDLAGLLLRCAESGVEVQIILIHPLPPRARPTVAVGAGKTFTRFEAKVVPPGAAILLPGEAAGLAKGAWQSLAELSIEITHEDAAIRGIIPLSGLREAVAAFGPSCGLR
jgi:hypothetical protein